MSVEFDSSKESSREDELQIVPETRSIGVRKAEILAAQWKGKPIHHFILLFSAFLVGYAYGLDGSTRYIYTGYATASFSEHSLLSTVNVINAVTGCAAQPVYARLSDYFGRLELFIVSILFYIVGTVIESQAYDVQRYAGGAILYQIGYTGAIIVLIFILSDFSSLKWRLFYTFVPTFPYIINTWISGNITAAIGLRWSWGIGMWAFIYPLACLPLIGCMLHMRWLASNTEEWKQLKAEETDLQKYGVLGFLKFLFWKVDIMGVLLLVICSGCILVPLTLAGGVKTEWQQGKIIAPLVVGVVFIPIFVFWEAKFARHPLLPGFLMRQRGVWGAILISFLFDFIFALSMDYFYTVLIVAVDESYSSATRISNLSSFVSCVFGVFYGLFIVKFRRMKFFMIFGCVLWLVSMGLFYRYRTGQSSHAGIIGGMVVIGMGTTMFSYPINVSIQSCVSHEFMAVATSIVYTAYRFGSAAGYTVSGAIWTQKLYPEILNQMGNATLATSAYSSPYEFALEYPWGTPERDQLINAYKYIQKIMLAASMAFCVPLIGAAFLLRDHKLGDEQSNDVEKLQNDDGLSNWLNEKVLKKSKN